MREMNGKKTYGIKKMAEGRDVIWFQAIVKILEYEIDTNLTTIFTPDIMRVETINIFNTFNETKQKVYLN